MALSASMFRQIVRSLKSDAGRRYNEQRGKPRVGIRGRVDLRCDQLAAGDRTAAWVRDLSVDGIGVLLAAPLAAGTRFTACFPQGDSDDLRVTYTVAYAKQVSKGLFVIGARLVDPGATHSAAA